MESPRVCTVVLRLNNGHEFVLIVRWICVERVLRPYTFCQTLLFINSYRARQNFDDIACFFNIWVKWSNHQIDISRVQVFASFASKSISKYRYCLFEFRWYENRFYESRRHEIYEYFPVLSFFFIILYLRIIYTLRDVILDTEFHESWIYIYIHKIELRFAQFRLVVSMKRGHV